MEGSKYILALAFDEATVQEQYFISPVELNKYILIKEISLIQEKGHIFRPSWG